MSAYNEWSNAYALPKPSFYREYLDSKLELGFSRDEAEREFDSELADATKELFEENS